MPSRALGERRQSRPACPTCRAVRELIPPECETTAMPRSPGFGILASRREASSRSYDPAPG